jgi:hypothetical protein
LSFCVNDEFGACLASIFLSLLLLLFELDFISVLFSVLSSFVLHICL